VIRKNYGYRISDQHRTEEKEETNVQETHLFDGNKNEQKLDIAAGNMLSGTTVSCDHFGISRRSFQKGDRHLT